MLLLYTIFLLLSCGIGEKDPDYDDDLVVKLDEGFVKGKWMDTWGGKKVRAYLGMPYAKPPINNLRFKDPEDVEPWEGIRNAFEDGSLCVQYQMKSFAGKEDCLYVNVFVPENTKWDLPVMVYIHGGFLVFGSSNSRDLGPEIFLDYSDFILVTMNYRLSVLGFLYNDDDDARGNAGFKDQVAALRWVKRNIGHFGGNPDQVTLFGHSAGSTSVGYHLHSDMSKGLFHRAILASSAMDSHKAASASFAKANTLKLAQLLDCPTHSNPLMMNCLREKSVNDIYSNLKHFQVWRIQPLLVFRPILENNCEENCFITEQSVKSRSSVPLIVGYTSEDGYVVSEYLTSKPELIAEVNEKFDEIIPLILRYDQYEDKDNITSSIKQFYLKNSDINDENVMDFMHMCGDVLYWRPMLKELIDHDGPTFVYYYTHRGTLTYLHNKKLKGVTHGDQQLVIFPYQNEFGEHRISERDEKVSKEFATLITRFVENREPYPGWKNFDLSEMNYLHIGTNEFANKKNFLRARSTFWTKISHDNTHDHTDI